MTTSRAQRHAGIVTLLLLVLAAALTPTSSSAAAGNWWDPVARPAPDSRTGVTGEPFKGTDSAGRVRGFVDAHNHIMSNEAFGGQDEEEQRHDPGVASCVRGGHRRVPPSTESP